MPEETQRIDKWLWCARLFKTRGLASDAVKNGRVVLNGQRAKPARAVRPGDRVVVRKPPYEFHLDVLGISAQRLSASRVSELYCETDESIEKRESLAVSIRASAINEDDRYGKITKKERREREKLKRGL